MADVETCYKISSLMETVLILSLISTIAFAIVFSFSRIWFTIMIMRKHERI